MKRPRLGLYKFLLLEPEEVIWQGLCLLSLLLAGLKVLGRLDLSWWWVLAPTLIPVIGMFLLTVGVILLVVITGCLLEDDLDA